MICKTVLPDEACWECCLASLAAQFVPKLKQKNDKFPCSTKILAFGGNWLDLRESCVISNLFVLWACVDILCAEPWLEDSQIVEDLAHQEVEERPQLVQVVLQRSACIRKEEFSFCWMTKKGIAIRNTLQIKIFLF